VSFNLWFQTRWTSLYLAGERFLALYPAIVNMYHLDYMSKTSFDDEAVSENLSDDDCKKLAALLTIVGRFAAATQYLQASRHYTLALLPLFVVRLREFLKESVPGRDLTALEVRWCYAGNISNC
jgi:hypothetical protein